MRERFQLPIPMCRVQYQLQGGNTRMLVTAIVCAALLTFGFLGFRRLFHDEPLASVADWSLIFLAGMQMLVAVFGGCNAVHRATLRDYETKMIESHRLTPMSNISVALGYLFGSTLQTMVVYIMVIGFGVVLTVWATSGLNAWLQGNLLILAGAVMLWAIVVFAGMRPAKPISPAGPLIGIAAVGNIGLVALPGVGLLVGAYAIIGGITTITSGSGTGAGGVGALVFVAMLLTVFWLTAAAAKYRRPDLPALNAFRGLMLLAIWLVFATLGIAAQAFISTGSFFPIDDEIIRNQWVATMILSLVVALVPLNGVVACRLLISRGALPRGRWDRASDLVVAFVAAAMICLAMGLIGIERCQEDVPRWLSLDGAIDPCVLLWLLTGVVCLSALLSARGLFVLSYGLLGKPRLIAGLVLALAWGGPSGAALVIAEATHVYNEPLEVGWLFGCSPVGSLVTLWTDLETPLAPGLTLQVLLAAVATLAAWYVGRRRFAQRPDPAPTQPTRQAIEPTD